PAPVDSRYSLVCDAVLVRSVWLLRRSEQSHAPLHHVHNGQVCRYPRREDRRVCFHVAAAGSQRLAATLAVHRYELAANTRKFLWPPRLQQQYLIFVLPSIAIYARSSAGSYE